MYLEKEMIRQLVQILRGLFPRHKLICNLASRKFFEKYSRTMHEKIAGLETSFKFTADDPEKIFLENGYRRTSYTSIVEKAAEFELIKITEDCLKDVITRLSRRLRNLRV